MADEKTKSPKKQSAGAERPSGPASVAADLRRLIVDGGFKAGARVTERAVAERFGCTAATTREAFHLLEKQGAIVLSARRGARVIAEDEAPTGEVFLVWDRLRWLLGEELRRHGVTVQERGEAEEIIPGAPRSDRLGVVEKSLLKFGDLSRNRRLADAMTRVALHVSIVAPDRFDEIEASLAR